MTQQHLINANIHRAKEGARVLEDIARFILQDESLFQYARDIRHQIPTIAPEYETTTDIGGTGLTEDNIRSNLLATVQANALRLQEALRVIEEFSQTQTTKHAIKISRYMSYTLHRDLYTACAAYVRNDKLHGLYIILDPNITPVSLEIAVEIINQTPVNIIQLRDKVSSKANIIKAAEKIRGTLNQDKLLVINDHVDIAVDIADGLHIGQSDYPISRMHKLIPENFILGISCHNKSEAQAAESAGASYISIGSIFATKSKTDTTPTSLQTLKEIQASSHIPVCAIGGINSKNTHMILQAGVNFAAIISDIWKKDNPRTAILETHNKLI